MGGPPTVTGCSCVDPQRTSTSFPGVLITELAKAVAHQEFGGNVADPLAGAHVAPVAWSSARFARCGFLCPTPEPGWTRLPQRVEAPASVCICLSARQPGVSEEAVQKCPGGPMRGGPVASARAPDEVQPASSVTVAGRCCRARTRSWSDTQARTPARPPRCPARSLHPLHSPSGSGSPAPSGTPTGAPWTRGWASRDLDEHLN